MTAWTISLFCAETGPLWKWHYWFPPKGILKQYGPKVSEAFRQPYNTFYRQNSTYERPEVAGPLNQQVKAPISQML